MSDERIPYSEKKRRPLERGYPRLPQDRSADQDINAAVDRAIADELRSHPVNLGFATRKGNR